MSDTPGKDPLTSTHCNTGLAEKLAEHIPAQLSILPGDRMAPDRLADSMLDSLIYVRVNARLKLHLVRELKKTLYVDFSCSLPHTQMLYIQTANGGIPHLEKLGV